MAIVLYLYIYIALLVVHTNQKRFLCERPREKTAVLRERKEALGSPVSKVDCVEGRCWLVRVEGRSWLRHTELVQISHHTGKANSDNSDVHCHDLVGSHRRALVPMSRRTSAGDEARLHNEPNIPLHQSEWKEQLEATDVLCVQRSTSSPKE